MGDDPFLLREAVKDDLDDLARVHIEGFTEEPLDLYCFPYRLQYPADYWNWTRKEYENYLAQPTKYIVDVLEAPGEDPERKDGEFVIVGLAVWNIAVFQPSNKPSTNGVFLADRKDANKERCEAFAEISGKRFENYFARWGNGQYNLATLVIHPQFRRRRAGSQLVLWRIRDGSPVTVCASPMGRLLYKSLQFEEIGIETVSIPGEKESLQTVVMDRKPLVPLRH